MEENLDKSAKLMRHELGSIDLSDIEELKAIKLLPKDRQARASDAEIFWKNHFQKVLKLFIQTQLEYMAKISVDAQFARGTINGFYLVKDWFEDRVEESLARFEKEEEPKPGEAITPL